MKRSLLVFLNLVVLAITAFSQTKNVQPSIMIVPFTKEGEDIRQTIEGNVFKRGVLTSIKEEFDNRGFTTIDFLGKFRARSAQSAFQANNQTDEVSEIVKNSGADIFITSEIVLTKRPDGAASVNIILSGYDTSTGASLANKQAMAGPFKTSDYMKLADVAIKKDMDIFMNNLQDKFNQMLQDGRSIMVSFGIDEGSQYTFESEVGSDGNSLADEIEIWMENNAYKGYYHMEGVTELAISFDEVKIPLRDPKNETKPYTISKFGRSMNDFFKQLGIEINRKTNGNQLYISIK